MADSRIRTARKNIAVSFLGQIVTLACGLVVPGALLRAFGSEVYGACSSITQFLSYIALLEGGIGGVARAALYKPLAHRDGDAIWAILAEIRRFFQVILLIFGVYVLALAFGFQNLTRVEGLDRMTTFFLVIVISLSTFAQYGIGIPHSILLQAAQMSYITNGVNILATLANGISVVLLVRGGWGILWVKLAGSLIYGIKPVVLWLYVRRHFPAGKSPRRDKQYLTQKWSGLGQHIAYFLHSNTDIAILTWFADFKAVAIYTVYRMIVTNIQNLAAAFVSGMEALFGDMLAKGEENALGKTFEAYELGISVVSVTLFSVTEILILPFVRLYTQGISDADYQAPVFAWLLILSALLYCLRLPYHAVVIAAGHFAQTKAAAYGEALLNILASVLLVSRMGLVGVAVGTAVATLFRFLYYAAYLSKHILKRDIRRFLKRFGVNLAIFGFSCWAGNLALSKIHITGYITWGAWGLLVFLLEGAFVVGINVVCYRKAFVDLGRTALARFGK